MRSLARFDIGPCIGAAAAPLPQQQLVRGSGGDPDDPEEVLRRAGVRLRSSGAIHYLSKEQLAAIIEELEVRPPGSSFPYRLDIMIRRSDAGAFRVPAPT